MKSDAFPAVRVDAAGQYHLVEKSELDALIVGASWMRLLKAPSKGPEALAFTLRVFMAKKDLNLSSLARQSGAHRGALTEINQATQVRGPIKETLDRLITFFGPEFKEALVLQGLYEDD